MDLDAPAEPFERLVAGLARARLTHWVPKILHMHVAWCFGLENRPPLAKTVARPDIALPMTAPRSALPPGAELASYLYGNRKQRRTKPKR